jgi:hypothetical protein
MDKHTNLKGMVSKYKNPTMDKHTNIKGMVSRYKNPTQWKNLLSIVWGFNIWIPFLLS